jgi:hypothetical protein
MSIPISAIRDTSTNPVQQVPIIDGTGFVVRHGESYYLVTNWRVATGRDPVSGENLGLSDALPQRIMGWLHLDHEDHPNSLGWHAWAWNLYDENDRAQWYVHPEFGSQVDIAALPIDPPESINSGHDRPTRYFPYSLESVARPAALYPTSDVSIVGFPAGVIVGGKLPVWTRGTVATKPAASLNGNPAFLVDSRTRPGQSGSPVIGYWIGPRVLADGTTYVGGEDWELFGIYSGRTSPDSDLGRVWRLDAIRQVIEGERRDSLVFDRGAD